MFMYSAVNPSKPGDFKMFNSALNDWASHELVKQCCEVCQHIDYTETLVWVRRYTTWSSPVAGHLSLVTNYADSEDAELQKIQNVSAYINQNCYGLLPRVLTVLH